MAFNSFGTLFRITTFGESHGVAIGVVIDGCPAGLCISKEEIDRELALRQPGLTPYTSPRKEKDEVEILSGLFEEKTTGAPIALLIRNSDVQSSPYAKIKDLFRPGHANYTYLKKYGVFDDRGGGRASARETAARVAAGAVAKKFIRESGIELYSFLEEMGGIKIQPPSLKDLKQKTLTSPIFCPDKETAKQMIEQMEKVKSEGDSVGGVVQTIATGLPVGLGEPIYDKLEAKLAYAMLSIPASKGFEIGSGFEAARMRGSEHNDAFDLDEKGDVTMQTNHAGGTLAGISTGLALYFRVPFKPTSSIQLPQKTVNFKNEKATFELPPGSRHDPCVAIRAVPVVEAMTALVLADALLLAQTNKMALLSRATSLYPM